MSRISEVFAELKSKRRGGFIPFITAGDPDLSATEELLRELARAGADIIEVGVPFSDPVADGPVIQRASERALGRGTNLKGVLECITAAKRQTNVPIVLFSYYNPLLQFGLEKLATAASRTGVDAVLVTDLIPEEAGSWTSLLVANNLDPIFLVAPTTNEDRLRLITQQARGFVYAISRTGVTGARENINENAESLVRRIRGVTPLPVAVGFGVSTPAQVREVWHYADAAVVGSAIVSEIERLSGDRDLVRKVGQFARNLTQ
ncbi:MAG TPA: tryptophan synthase subunit alpha [Chthoniobacterales bacterium]|jgi:tryptophan synthase alpha chain|nr:tryptophan synthase subunit alpha [Chthoniobacterales bacterium]